MIAHDTMIAHDIIPLRLEALANASDEDFGHDVFGIRRHLDRAGRKMNDCFLPRYARNE